jgi:hypothetical protein
MELALLVYLAEVVGNISIVLFIVSVFSFLIMFVLSLAFTDSYGDEKEKLKKLIKRFSLTFIIVSTLFVVIPSERPIWIMAGVYSTQLFSESKEYDKVIQVINKKLDEFLTDEGEPNE